MLAQAMKPVEALTDIRVQHGGIAAFRSAFSLDGRQFAIHALTKGTGTQQAVIKLYDTATGALLEELPDAPALPLTLSFLPDGRRLIASGFPDDNYAGAPFTRLWDLDTPQQPLRLDGINGLAGRGLNPEGTRLLIAGADGLRVHDARSGELLAHWLRRHSVLAAAYSPDGSTIATAAASGQLRLLSARPGPRPVDRRAAVHPQRQGTAGPDRP